MIISLLAIPVLFVLILVLLRYNRKASEKATVAPAEPPHAAPPVDDRDAVPLAEQWTSLDDHQLNRLLRESSS